MASVTIELPPDTERRLRATGAQEGSLLSPIFRKSPSAQLLPRMESPVLDQRRVSFEELTQPIASAVASAGASDEDVEALFNEAVADVRAERRSQRAPSS